MPEVSATEAGRALVAQRPTEVIECVECGAERTVVVRRDAKRALTCGRRCREKLLYRTRKAAKPKP